MKSKIIIVLLILNIIMAAVISNLLINREIKIEKQIIKEMTEGEYESKITELNKSHNDYSLQVQDNKKKLATAITNQKVETSENDTIDQMVENIDKILQARTEGATATEDNITEGKTAWVNGKLITGTGKDNDNSYESGMKNSSFTDLGKGTSFDMKTLLPGVDYTKLTEDNFIVGIYSVPSVSCNKIKDIMNATGLGYGINYSHPMTSVAKEITMSKTYDSTTGVLTVDATQTVYTTYLRTTGALANTASCSQSATCFAYYIP